MYERMLDKQLVPSFEDLISYCGAPGEIWVKLDKYLRGELNMEGKIRFPYGKKYGWSINYIYKKKHVCDVFAEKDAFMILIRLSGDNINMIYDELNDYSKNVCDNKYPCGDGGWLNYRITSEEQLQDIIKIIETRVKKHSTK